MSISVPDDVTLCNPGPVLLNGQIIGNYYGFEWVGSNGYYNNTQLSPTTNITGNTTFTLRAFGDPQVNLIQNGDFEFGNTGFSTQYTYSPTSLWTEGMYTVTNNPNSVHSGFAACTAQSQNQMMVLNGAPSLAQVWCQSVPVQPNTLYVFWAWAASVNPSNPARLQFSINGNLLGPQMQLTPSLCVWQQFYTTWFSGSQTSADICIVNQNTLLSGNDFAIDNLFFGPLCEEEVSFDVVIEEFEILPQFPDVIDCYFSEQIIEAVTIPSLANASYAWSTQYGVINSSPTDSYIYAAAGGQYMVTVTSANGCTETMEFLVEEDLHVPDIRIAGNTTLDCYAAQADLFAYEYQGIPCQFTWTNPAGTKIQGPSLFASSPGIYSVTGIGDNGCESTTTIEVVLDENTFDYQIPLPESFTCLVDSVQLSLRLSLPVDSLVWSVGKTSKNPGLSDSIQVYQPGIYYVTLYKGSFCEVTDSIRVDYVQRDVGYSIQKPDTLTCLRPESQIVLSDKVNILSFHWQKDSINLGQRDTLSLTQPGTYILYLTDSLGCQSTDTVLVGENKKETAYTVQVDSIDCLSGVGKFHVTVDTFLELHWIGQGYESNSKEPEFEKEGYYYLTIMGENGCISTDSFYLPSSIEFPFVQVTHDTITCADPVANISISTNSNVTLYWTGPGNSSGSTGYFETNLAGQYSLEARNEKGCITYKNFEIQIDTITPYLTIEDSALINCNQPTFLPQYSAPGTTQRVWTFNGNFYSDEAIPVLNQPGTYTLEVFGENGCKTKQDLILIGDFTPPYIRLEYQPLNCYQPSTEVLVIGQNQGLYYLDSQPVDTLFPLSQAGQYQFTAVNPNGCDTSFTFEVTGDFSKHAPEVNPVLLDCYQPEKYIQDINFQSGIQYQWNYNGTIIPGDSMLIYENAVVLLTATAASGCDSTILIPIVIDKQIPEAEILGNAEIKCSEDSTTLYVNAGEGTTWTWLWNQQIYSGEDSLLIKKPGVCILQVFNPANGCNNLDSILISKQPEPEQLIFQFQSPPCPEDDGLLLIESVIGGTAPYRLYRNGVLETTGIPITITDEGLHTLSLTDNLGCRLDTTFRMDRRPPFEVDAGRDTLLILGESTILIPTSTLAWDSISSVTWFPRSGLDCDDCIQPICTPEVHTRYTITMVDNHGCIRSDHLEIRVLALKGYDAPNIIFPGRPGNDRFTLYSLYNSVSLVEDLKIFDRWGDEVFSGHDLSPGEEQDGWDGTFHDKRVIPGVYVWVAKLIYRDGTTAWVSGDLTVIED